jgi:hypothetical protein
MNGKTNFGTNVEVVNVVQIGSQYLVGKIFKIKYWKWICIFHLQMWVKSYGKKMEGNQIRNLTSNHNNLGNNI